MANFLSFGNYAGENYGYDFAKMSKAFENNPTKTQRNTIGIDVTGQPL